ncbi:MAG: hypothetical protein AAF399_27465 [Bacteroidota bacterium]
MKVTIQRLPLLAIALIATLFVSSAFSLAPTPPPYLVGSPGQGIKKEVRQQLRRAYMAEYGRQAKLSKIEIVKHKGINWLAFQSGGTGSPTLAIELSKFGDKWGFGPNAAKNTCTGSPCSWCYFDTSKGCVCNGDGGGTCNHTQESLKGMDQFKEVLSM